MSEGPSSASRRFVYHLTALDSWEQQENRDTYTHDSLAREGFIHCSDRSQVRATWKRVFAESPGLIVLEIEISLLTSELRYEEGEPGEFFPHIYGTIPRVAIVGVRRPDAL